MLENISSSSITSLILRHVCSVRYSVKGKQTHLREKRPLVLGLLDTVSHQSLHGFRTTLIELTEVWRQISPTNHVNDLNKTVNQKLKKAQGTTVNTCN